jgi:hypothetical protein
MDTEAKYQFIKTRLQMRFPFFAGILTKGEQTMDAQWREELVNNLEKLFGDVQGKVFDKALGGYVEFSIDAAKNQEFFLKRGHYKATKYMTMRITCSEIICPECLFHTISGHITIAWEAAIEAR